MNRYYVRNVRKAAELELAARRREERYEQDKCLYLVLRDGMNGWPVKTLRYQTVGGMLRNSGRKVRALFSSIPARENDGRPYSFPIHFEATY